MDRLVIAIPDSVEVPFTKTLVVNGNGLELPDAEPRFQVEGSLSVLVEPVGNGYVLTGSLIITAEMDCSRCLESVVVQVDEPFRIFLGGIPMDTSPENDWFALDTETREFDIAPLVRELVLIGLPAKPLCCEDCLGLCAECGGNRNTGSCSCEGHRGDPRWAGLAVLRDRLEMPDVLNNKENMYNGSPKTESIEESPR
jgi:uncharacterized metal-binding protein YceD (DUF177 family)